MPYTVVQYPAISQLLYFEILSINSSTPQNKPYLYL